MSDKEKLAQAQRDLTKAVLTRNDVWEAGIRNLIADLSGEPWPPRYIEDPEALLRRLQGNRLWAYLPIDIMAPETPGPSSPSFSLLARLESDPETWIVVTKRAIYVSGVGGVLKPIGGN